MKKNKNNEFDPYKPDKLSRMPLGLKVFILKAWTAGAIFFMFNMGFAAWVPNHLDRWLILMLVTGLIFNYFVNKVLQFMENDKQPMNAYMMIGKHRYSVVINVIYMFVLVLLIAFFGSAVLIQNNIAFSVLIYPENPAGWDPIMFAILFYIFDWGALKLKTLIVNLVNKRKDKEDEKI